MGNWVRGNSWSQKLNARISFITTSSLILQMVLLMVKVLCPKSTDIKILLPLQFCFRGLLHCKKYWWPRSLFTKRITKKIRKRRLQCHLALRLPHSEPFEIAHTRLKPHLLSHCCYFICCYISMKLHRYSKEYLASHSVYTNRLYQRLRVLLYRWPWQCKNVKNLQNMCP